MKSYYLFIVIYSHFIVCLTAKLTSSLKIAQCRANCLNKFDASLMVEDRNKKCRKQSDCFTCWQTCEKLIRDYPIWSFKCDHKTGSNAGWASACNFFSTHLNPQIPLSPSKSRLTLIFGGSSAQWSLVWGQDTPPQKAVFALFTRTKGKPWTLRLQTSEHGALLQDLAMGTELMLVAVADSGLLSVIITPFEPATLHRKGGADDGKHLEEMFPWNKGHEIRGEPAKGWPLLYEASVQDSGLVAVKVWWSIPRPKGSDYLVTWEVAAGGLKGHLYTDLPEVDLKLWPKTIYKVQVEIVSGPLSEPHVSQLLILDTSNITAVAQSHFKGKRVQDSVSPTFKRNLKNDFPLEYILIGVSFSFIAIVISITVICRKRGNSRFPFNDSTSNSKLSLNRSIADLALDENLVRGKDGALLSSTPDLGDRFTFVYSVPYSTNPGSQNTIGIPSIPNDLAPIQPSALGVNGKECAVV